VTTAMYIAPPFRATIAALEEDLSTLFRNL